MFGYSSLQNSYKKVKYFLVNFILSFFLKPFIYSLLLNSPSVINSLINL